MSKEKNAVKNRGSTGEAETVGLDACICSVIVISAN